MASSIKNDELKEKFFKFIKIQTSVSTLGWQLASRRPKSFFGDTLIFGDTLFLCDTLIFGNTLIFADTLFFHNTLIFGDTLFFVLYTYF